MGHLLKYFPRRLIGICAGYKQASLVAAVAAVTLNADDSFSLSFPKRNPFSVGDPVTVHLDDREGSEVYSVELPVHRTSYKGIVATSEPTAAQVTLDSYELFFGNQLLATNQTPGYGHPSDARSARELQPTPLSQAILPDDNERSNQLGVLVTKASVRPHTTVMAFLNSSDDDVFLITQKDSFKYQLLSRDPDCAFAMDHRATFSFEHHVDWNYTIYESRAHRIDRSLPLFQEIQNEFILKNPWETTFFSSPKAEMIHLVPKRIIHQDILCL